MKKICEICKNEFKAHQSRNRFCSIQCSNEARKTVNISYCLVCSKQTYNKRFCSRSCSASFNNIKRGARTESTKIKISIKLKKSEPRTWEISCKLCGILFKSKNRNTKYCSRKCLGKGCWIYHRSSMQNACDNRDHPGWSVRNNRSFAEKFWEDVLSKHGIYRDIHYKTEHIITKKSLGINKRGHYFLDFYFPILNIDLEIDGRQHNDPERKESDKVRDSLLTNIGIRVIRFPWLGISKEDNCNNTFNQVKEFLEYWSSQSDLN